MSYYVLPKINIDYNLQPTLYNSMDNLKPSISSSLINYTKESNSILQHQLSLECNTNITFRMLTQIIHSYDFLFSCVSGFDIPVTNVNVESAIYFDIVEIFQTLKICEKIVPVGENINALCCGKYSNVVSKAFKFHCNIENMHITTYNLEHYKSSVNLVGLGKINNGLDYYENFEKSELMRKKCNLIYFEENEKNFLDINEYSLYLTKAILVANMYQEVNGCLIIKINTLFYKPVIDLIYILSHMYKKMYIMKPNTSNVILDDRYLVCKGYSGSLPTIINQLQILYNSLFNIKHDVIISSILKNKIYYYFLNKIEESNVIIGQQKLDAYSHLINLLKSKNKMEKIELLQKHNIQKCVYWCEKHRVEYNKITEQMNLFIPNQTCTREDGEVSIDLDVDDIFYSYIVKHYGYAENDMSDDNEEEGIDIIDATKLSSYMKKRKPSLVS